MTEEKKKNKAYGLNENRVRLLGRVRKPPKLSKNEKYVRVPILLPTGRRGAECGWTPFVVDVTSDDYKQRALSAKPGDYFKASCFIIGHKIKDDDDNNKTVLKLQVDNYETVGVVPMNLEVDEFDSPEDDGLCMNDVTILGRFVQRKKLRDEGQNSPVLRGDKNKVCFPNLVYNDPKNPEAEGVWIEPAVFGKSAEIASEYMKHMDQVYIHGELGKRAGDFQVKGKTPDLIRISTKPYGMQFVSLGGRKDSDSAPKGPDTGVYDDDETEDLDF